MLEILKNPSFDFLGKTKIFVALSLALIFGGFGFMLATGVYIGANAKGYGVEFSGGTQLILHFEKTPATDRIRAHGEAMKAEQGCEATQGPLSGVNGHGEHLLPNRGDESTN